jgi:uncharacterized membrane protein
MGLLTWYLLRNLDEEGAKTLFFGFLIFLLPFTILILYAFRVFQENLGVFVCGIIVASLLAIFGIKSLRELNNND